MAHHFRSNSDEASSHPRPYWSRVLRALREARGITQEGWAAQLGYGRATVKRWEAGETVPSADAEATIIDLCREKGLFRTFKGGLLAGVHVTPEWLADQFTLARMGDSQMAAPDLNSRAATIPDVHYARSGDIAIAYQVFGTGPFDIVLTPGAASHREADWEHPGAQRFFDRLASLARVVAFDKRGTGMSDRVPDGTPQERMDDIRAVMDAADVRRAVLLGISEGGPLSILFATTYPERTQALLLYGAYARGTQGVHGRFGAPSGRLEQQIEHVRATWGSPDSGFLDVLGPSVAHDPTQRAWWAHHQQISASPGAIVALMRMNANIDIRTVLPLIRVPTLVLHRMNDRLVDPGEGAYLAEQIPGSKYVKLRGVDHLPWLGDVDGIIDAVEAFLRDVPLVHEVDAVLATVVIIEMIGYDDEFSSDSQRLLESFDDLVRRELKRYRGREICLNEGRLLATFDGPTLAVRCACDIRDLAKESGLEVRAGVHVGEVELRGSTLIGAATDVSSGLAVRANPGEVLVSSMVTDLVADSTLHFAERDLSLSEGLTRRLRFFAAETA